MGERCFMLKSVIDVREKAIKDYSVSKKQSDFLDGWWFGYFAAIEDILKKELTEEELKEYLRMEVA
jgi:hypothetical protein